MKLIKVITGAAFAVAIAFSGSAIAKDGKIDAVTPAKGSPLSELFSGYKYAKPGTQAMQDDEFGNPGMAWNDIGADLWNKKDGKAGKACATCHKDAATSMKGVGARYPIYFAPLKKIMNVEDRVNTCRTKYMKADKWKYDSNQMLGTVIYVKQQSLGMKVAVKTDGAAKAAYDAGKAFYYERRGQLDMSCAHCHEKYYGTKIRMNTLSQGQTNGFPVYRLKWQKPGSAHRRFKGCNKQVRARPFKSGSNEYLNLELYLAARGNGLTVETPAVRN